MKKTVGVIALGILAAACSFGSTISSLTNTVGNSFTISAIGASSVKASDLVSIATFSVQFSDASTSTCTFANLGGSGGGSIGCSLTSGASGAANIALSPANSQTNSAGWMINNTGTLSVVTVTINLNTATASTPIGFDSGSVGTNSSGTAFSGSAVLSDALHTSGQAATAATQYARLILSFSGSTFATGNSFGFSAANHFITGPVIADTPEPTTYALVGIGLVGLAVLKRKRKL